MAATLASGRGRWGAVWPILAALFAVAVPAAQSLAGFGQSPAEFAKQGDKVLRAAPYAFAIWGLIYTGMLVYAAYQAGRMRDLAAIALRGPMSLSMVGCGAWILASAFDLRLLSVVIIAASAAVLSWALVRLGHARGRPATFACVLWPADFLAGWLTVATGLNLVTVLAGWGLVTEATATIAGVGAVIAVVAVALAVARMVRRLAYVLPIAWGLVAVWVAEHSSRTS